MTLRCVPSEASDAAPFLEALDENLGLLSELLVVIHAELSQSGDESAARFFRGMEESVGAFSSVYLRSCVARASVQAGGRLGILGDEMRP